MRSGNHGLLRRLPQKFRMGAYPSVSSGAITASSAANTKPLIFLCIGITALLIAAGAASSAAVLAFFRLRSPVGSVLPDTAPSTRKGYTILINTWKRNDLLHESVLHYSKCDGVDSIHVIWSEPEPPSDSLYDALSEAVDSNSKIGSNVDLIFDLNDEDSLNNRFQEIQDLNFDAIFSIDDDVIFPCKSVEFAFTVWKSAPETMVGFVPRMLWLDTIVIQSTIFMVGGGQSGGPALTTWFFPRLLFSIRNIFICIVIKCLGIYGIM